MLQDIRYAARNMTKNPGFTAVAMLALALGIGANTSIFTVVNAILLRPLPYKDAGSMVFVLRKFPDGRGSSASIPKFFAWKRGTADVLTSVAAYDFMGPGVSLSGEGQPEQVKAIHASADFFALFGVTPAIGRTFNAEEDRPNGPHAAVISHGLWKRRFGADPQTVGRAVVLSGEPYTVVGVTPADFEPDPPADIWLPLQADPNSLNQGHYLLCGGRLKPGVTEAAANARLKAVAEQFRRQYPDAMNKDESAEVAPMREFMVGQIRSLLLIMQGAVGFVLLISCANIANLLLARAASREKEIAIRTALGAGRWRLVRQLFTESGLLALGGGALGLLLGYLGLKLLLAFTPQELPRIAELGGGSLDPRVLAFTLAASLATGILFGLAPAIQLLRLDLHSTLKESTVRTTSGVRHLRVRGLLVIGEMALGLVLLIGAGLLIRSAISIDGVDPGFETHRVLTFKTALTGAKYANTAAVAEFSRQLVERLDALPGVRGAANIINVPTEPGPDLTFHVEGRAANAPHADGDEQWRYCSAELFKALSVPLLRGRVFTVNDTAKAPPVVIINQALARKYWPKEDPVGQRMTIGKGISGSEFADPTREVIGVVGNTREYGLNNDPPPMMFVPQPQVNDGLTALGNRVLPMAWVVRTSMDPMLAANAVRREVTAVDSGQAVFDFRAMDQVLEKALANNRFVLLLLSLFAGAALALAAIGVYGVMSYAVEQRTNEIGIRMALGAGRRDVQLLVVRNGMTLAGIGVAIGLAAAFGLTRVLSALLFGVKATDPLTFAAVALALSAVALAATWIPALRATRVDPIVALRCE